MMPDYYNDFEDEYEFASQQLRDVEHQVEQRNKKERFNFDTMLSVVGVSLAISAAFFPWYVFVNQDKFSVREMAYGDDRILPGTWQGRPVVNVSPQAIPGRDLGIENAPLPPDSITTASIPDAPIEPSIKKSDEGLDVSRPQAYPGTPKYRLLHVVNGRALIEDASGTYIVQVGSVLPDNSRLSALEERRGGWALITSQGDVLEN